MATILLATADAATAAAVEAVLMALGHDVAIVDSGVDVVDTALSRAPALVLLDRALTVHDGFEVAALLRADPEVPAELPVLLLSDDAIPATLRERHGIDAVLPKRHDAAALTEAVVDALMRNPHFRG